MFSRFTSLIAITPLLVFAGSLTPAAAADYSGCSLCGGGDYQVDYDTPDGDYFNSDTDFSKADPDANFVLRGSMGMTSITANEHVYYFATGPENLSLLVWQSVAPIASLDAKARLPGQWTLRGHIDAAIAGDSKMTDYDWLGYSPSLDQNDWDHRSISPNTSLDWYLNGSIALGRDLPINEALTVNVNGGFQYTDVQWTAVGGTYIYSTSGFRDTVGTIPDVPGVRYRQQLPTLFAGVDATVNDGAWSLEAGGRAGLMLYGRSRDDHYLRVPPFYVVDDLNLGQVLSANAKLGYAFSDHLGVFVSGSYEKMFAGHTPTHYYDMATNALNSESDKAGGGELDVASLKVGLKGNF